MGACLSLCTSSGIQQPPRALDTSREHAAKKVEGLRALVHTTATHIEPQLAERVQTWSTECQRRIAQPSAAGGEERGCDFDASFAFERLIKRVGPESRTLSLLKAMSQVMVLCSVSFLFQQCGLLELVSDGVPADVRGSWRVEIDLRDPIRPAITHFKAQGKPKQQVSVHFAVELRFRLADQPATGQAQRPGGGSLQPREKCEYGRTCYRKNSEHKRKYAHPGDVDWTCGFVLDTANLRITQFNLNNDSSILPPSTGQALQAWHYQTVKRLAASDSTASKGHSGAASAIDVPAHEGTGIDDNAVAAWKRDLADAFNELHPQLGSTPHDIYRLAHAVSFVPVPPPN